MYVQKSMDIVAKSESGSLVIEGYGSVFGNVDHSGEIVAPGAFAKSIKKGRIHFLLAHDWRRPIGWITKMEEDEKGLKYVGEVDPTEEVIYKKVASGLFQDASFLARVVDYSWETVKGEPVRLLKELDIKEISVVARGANPLASAVAKSFDDLLLDVNSFDLIQKEQLINALQDSLKRDPKIQKTELEKVLDIINLAKKELKNG